MPARPETLSPDRDSIRDQLHFKASEQTIAQFKAWFEILCSTPAQPEVVQGVLHEMVNQGWLTFSVEARVAQDTAAPQFRIFFLGIVEGIHQNIELVARVSDISEETPHYTVAFRTPSDQEVFLRSLDFLNLDSTNDMTFTDGLAAYISENYQALLETKGSNFPLKVNT